MAQVLLALVREHSDLDAAASVSRISHDEVIHTELSRGLAEALGGYVEEVPEALPYDPGRLAHGSTLSAASWLLTTAVSESVSLELMALRLTRTRHPVIHDVLARVMRDEAVHARTAWALFESLAPTLDPSQRRDLGEQAQGLFESLGRTFATAGLPPAARREARRLRDVTCEKGLGAATADDEDALCVDVIERVVPRLGRVGIQAR